MFSPSLRCRFRRTLPSLFEAPLPFEKYSEFDSLKESQLNEMINSKEEWVAEEKVNGANFSIHVFNRGNDVRFAKRSGFIAETEFFFGYTKLLTDFSKQIPIILSNLSRNHGDVESAIIYGELFGGKYVHPEISQGERFTDFKGQQRRISPVIGDFFPQYSPDIHFYAYDIKLRKSAQKPWVLLSPHESQRVFQSVPNLLYARHLFKGNMKKCMAFDLDKFETTIPFLLGLGDFVIPGNIAEGIVLKHSSRGGEVLHLTKSSILKFKHRAFQEARHKDGAKKGMSVEAERHRFINSQGETVVDPHSFLDSEAKFSLDSLVSLVNKEAWDSVCARQQEMNQRKFSKSIDATKALAEFALRSWYTTDSSEVSLKLNHSLKKYFMVWLSNAAESYVRSVWRSYLRDTC
uniref:RNA ligase domain-containing protein n=1 Tax=Paramoeba aestuarina TaxID=180227 RepID=A0A7S4NPR7_9EUKA|mmetsp:Transcript_21797/g.33869  ORF Transcript_21797/g.33869 Transcript_21797/m.33869 type:complete len:405 (+) Transcript_21797:59-1273(+)